MGYKEATDRIANLAGEDATRKDNVDHALRTKQIVLGVSAEAAGVDGNHLLYIVDKALTVVSFKIVDSIAVVASDTDYNTERLAYTDLAAGSPTNLSDAMTTKITGGAAYAADIPKTFTGLSLSSTVVAGKGIFLVATHGGSGKARGARSMILTVSYGP